LADREAAAGAALRHGRCRIHVSFVIIKPPGLLLLFRQRHVCRCRGASTTVVVPSHVPTRDSHHGGTCSGSLPVVCPVLLLTALVERFGWIAWCGVDLPCGVFRKRYAKRRESLVRQGLIDLDQGGNGAAAHEMSQTWDSQQRSFRRVQFAQSHAPHGDCAVWRHRCVTACLSQLSPGMQSTFGDIAAIARTARFNLDTRDAKRW